MGISVNDMNAMEWTFGKSDMSCLAAIWGECAAPLRPRFDDQCDLFTVFICLYFSKQYDRANGNKCGIGGGFNWIFNKFTEN